MTSVRQKIPNFIGGISQQPDEKIPPGTVKDGLNVIPDVKGILGKRPGSKLVGTLSDNIEGAWHHYFRDGNEQYFIRIRRNGQVDVWEALTGTPRIVKYNSNPYNLAEDKYLTDGQPKEDTDDAYPSCSPTAFAEKSTILQEKYLALKEHKIEIEQLEVKKNNLFTTEIYYEREGTKLITGYADPGITFESGYTPIVSNNKPVVSEDYEVIKEFKERVRLFYPIYQDGNAIFPDGLELESDCYAWRVERKEGTQEELDIDAQIDALNAQTDDLVDEYTVALFFYEQEAEKCGIFENPYSRVARSTEEVAAPEYFKHENDSDLQFLTVNDYTFVTNRTKVVNMADGDGSDELLAGEAFIELKQLEYNKPYVIRIYGEEPVTNEYTTATKLEVEGETSFRGADASCPLTGFSEGTVNGIQYRLTVTGYAVLEAEPDKKDAYDCQYRVEIDLISAEPNTGIYRVDANGNETGTKPFDVEVEGRTYTVKVVKESTSATTAESVISVPAINVDEKLDASAILTELATRIDDGTTAIDARVIGNGVYVSSQIKKFTVDTPDTLLFECINKEVNNVGLLPTQCKDGFVVKVKNSFIEEDDYYVKFVSTIPDTDGAGAWEETYKPGIQLGFDYYNMPHQIRRLSDGTFEASPVK